MLLGVPVSHAACLQVRENFFIKISLTRNNRYENKILSKVVYFLFLQFEIHVQGLGFRL